ncbi:MAG TPA: hypothetical protein VGJ16_12835 [Pirellulales bacterium]
MAEAYRIRQQVSERRDAAWRELYDLYDANDGALPKEIRDYARSVNALAILRRDAQGNSGVGRRNVAVPGASAPK